MDLCFEMNACRKRRVTATRGTGDARLFSEVVTTIRSSSRSFTSSTIAPTVASIIQHCGGFDLQDASAVSPRQISVAKRHGKSASLSASLHEAKQVSDRGAGERFVLPRMTSRHGPSQWGLLRGFSAGCVLISRPRI